MEVLREVAAAHAVTPAQAALAWVIRHPSVAAIPGASSVEQLESNLAAAEIDLTADETRRCAPRCHSPAKPECPLLGRTTSSGP